MSQVFQVSQIFSTLLEVDLSLYDASSLRYLTGNEAALPSNHIKRIREAFPLALLYIVFGLSGIYRMFYLPPYQIDARPDFIGIPIPGTEAWIDDKMEIVLNQVKLVS